MAETAGLDGRLLAAALVSGVANGMLLTVIVTAASPADGEGPEPTLESFFLFVAFLLLFFFAEKYVLDQAVRTLEGIIRGVRLRITDKLRKAELADFEKLGQPHIFAVLSQDTLQLGTCAYEIMRVLSSLIVVLFGFGFIATLSENASMGMVLLLLFGVAIYWRNQRVIQKRMREGAEIEGRFFESLKHLLHGFKEQRLNAAKSDDLFENSLRHLAVENERVKSEMGFRINDDTVFAPVFFYLLIGFVVFVLPQWSDVDEPTIQIVTMILFILGPLGNVVAAYPAMAKAEFSIDRVRALEAAIEGFAEPQSSVSTRSTKPFERLTTHELEYTYLDPAGNPGFTAGPFDLEFERGRIVFLVGGNGSGKSTFLLMLCGLYAPTRGHIKLNDRRITRETMSSLRECTSIVLQDFHLFDRLYGLEEWDHERAEELVEELRLEGVTRVLPDGRIERVDLSMGQKKRLALLVTDLENRDVLVFDEWAADQDPESRRRFYTEILPALRARGKTVIAATHDDHYFDAADELIKLAEGKVVYRGPPGETAFTQA